MKSIQIVNYIPNPRGVNGQSVFNKSQTQTPYQRFNALGPDANGQIVTLLVFLNANQVETMAVLPELMQGKEVQVDDLEYQVALEAPRAFDGVTAIAVTNFTMAPDMDIIDVKLKGRAELSVARDREARKAQDTARNSFLGKLATGAVESRLDARLQNPNRGGLAAKAGTAEQAPAATLGAENEQ